MIVFLCIYSMAALQDLPEVMDAPAIEEREVRTYTNIAGGQLPEVGRSVEILYFFLTRNGYPLQTYSIYKGTVLRRDGESITLALGASCTYVTELETLGERAARQNVEGGVQLTTFGDYNIYWKVAVTIPSIPRTPERRKRRLRAIELYYEPITPTKSTSAEYETPTSTMVSPSRFGGKRTKRRKSRRKK
jgi:hypothetical protein